MWLLPRYTMCIPCIFPTKKDMTQITDPTTIGKLLTRQIAETVQWQRSIEYAKSRGVTEWIVIGPSRVLGNLLRKEYPNDTIVSISNAEDILSYKKGEIIKS